MKRSVLAAIVLACLSLCACGGGGGGGGGSGLSDAEVFAFVPADGEVIRDGGGISVTKTAGGLQLKVDGSGGLDPVFHRTVSFSTARDFKEEGNYFTAQKTGAARQFKGEATEGYGDIRGQAAITDKIYLGGKKLGLEYSEFGIWQVSLGLNGKVDGHEVNEELQVGAYTFHAGDDQHKRGFNEVSGQASFTGRALGQAFDETPDVSTAVNVFGTAKLDMDLGAGGATGSLALDFDNFYKFKVSVSSDGDGELHETALTEVTANANTTGISLDTNTAGYASHVRGQLYGPAGASATEGTGTFEFVKGSKGVYGAFGVKR